MERGSPRNLMERRSSRSPTARSHTSRSPTALVPSIPSSSVATHALPSTEKKKVFAHDAHAHPGTSTLAEYFIPVEDFGLAMHWEMGW